MNAILMLENFFLKNIDSIVLFYAISETNSRQNSAAQRRFTGRNNFILRFDFEKVGFAYSKNMND